MEIDKALLEKYELGRCTEAEIALVEQWLDREEWDELPTLIVEETLGEKIWENVLLHTEAEENAQKAISATRLKSRKIIFLISGIAASLILFFYFGVSVSFYGANEASELTVYNNEDAPIWVKEDFFDVLLTRNSTAEISIRTRIISSTGDILLKPKHDFSLQDKYSHSNFNFKSGLVYILSRDANTNKLLVFSEQELNFLPPAIQRHYINQFQTI